AMSASAASCAPGRPERRDSVSAFRVEHDDVVLPEALEQPTALRLPGCSARAENFAERTRAIDRREEPLLGRVDEEREIGIHVRGVDEHGGNAARRPVLHAQRPWQANRNVAAPGLVL